MSALGQKQPLNILSGERLVSGVYRPFGGSFFAARDLNVRFHQERPFRTVDVGKFERPLTAMTGRSAKCLLFKKAAPGH